MKIKLMALDIINFKGIKAFGCTFNGENATITAANGVGKTSVYDALLWNLFNKNSEGKSTFGNRPLDENKQPIKGLTVSVKVVFDVDGKTVTLKRNEIEKLAKKHIVKGFTSEYEINGVPGKLEKEYKAFIADIITEDKFRALTDLNYFNTLPWVDQRKVLIEIAGSIGVPAGFDDLMDSITGKSMDDAETVAKREKKAYEKERDAIPIQINEVQLGCKDYATEVNQKELDGTRIGLKSKIGQLDRKRDKYLGSEQERQSTIATTNLLKMQQIERERVLVNDTSGVGDLFKEKIALQEAAGEIKKDIQSQQMSVTAYTQDRDTATKKLAEIREIYTTAEETPIVDTCLACNRKLETDQIETVKAQNEKTTDDLADQGNEAKADVKTAKLCLENAESVVKSLQEKLAKAENSDRLKEIDRLIERNEPPKKENDNAWKVLALKIHGHEESLGDSVADVLQEIETERSGIQTEVEKINSTLNNADRLASDTARITELSNREKELTQLIADIDKMLEQIDEYGKAESDLIEKAVNGKFDHVEFKLFKQFQNGEVEPYCVATLGGVSYPDFSRGEEILSGIDIINVLSVHFDMSVVLFIDNAESLTFGIEAKSQVIRLVAAPGVTELTVNH